jgi:hypothetical protein
LLPGLVVILGAVMGGFVLAGQRFKQVEHHVFCFFFSLFPKGRGG